MIITVDIGGIVDGTVDNNGEFDQFSFLFLNFLLKNRNLVSILTLVVTF